MKTNKILVINNDIDTMSLIQQALRLKGYDVKYSGDKIEVESLLSGFKPDIILIDILRMNMLDEAGAFIREHKPGVLMMTGYNNQEDSLIQSPDSYIKKPFTIVQLQKSIEKMLRIKRN